MDKAPILKRLLMLLIYLLGVAGTTLHAEGGCPSGMVPEGGQGTSSCRPLPGYDQSGNGGQPLGPRAVTYLERWGAVAMDTYETANVGAAHAKSSRAEAEKIAMKNCLDLGSKKCQLISTYSNGCVALAESGAWLGIASRATLSESESAALSQCKDASCKVVFHDCSMAKRIQ